MTDTVHTYPVRDLVEHDTTGCADCVCGPTTTPVEREDGSMGWSVLHHSLDGRELTESSPNTAKETKHDSR